MPRSALTVLARLHDGELRDVLNDATEQPIVITGAPSGQWRYRLIAPDDPGALVLRAAALIARSRYPHAIALLPEPYGDTADIARHCGISPKRVANLASEQHSPLPPALGRYGGASAYFLPEAVAAVQRGRGATPRMAVSAVAAAINSALQTAAALSILDDQDAERIRRLVIALSLPAAARAEHRPDADGTSAANARRDR